MNLEDLSHLLAALESFATILSLLIGGIWVYMRFIRQQEKYPNIEFLADIEFIGFHKGWWIAEIVATVNNKGKAQHKMTNFQFDLNAIFNEDAIDLSEQWGNQVNFPKSIAKGSFLPSHYQYFFIDPGTEARYSYIARIPKEAMFLILHCWFNYANRRNFKHVAEKTVKVPLVEIPTAKNGNLTK